MKTIIAFCLLAFMAMNSINAQEKSNQLRLDQQKDKFKSPEERAKNNAHKAEKQLGLSADQKQKWESAALIKIKANQPLRLKLEGSTTPQERKTIHQEMKKNNEAFEKEVNVFLSEDQKAKFNKIKSQKRANKRHHENEQEAPSVAPSLIKE